MLHALHGNFGTPADWEPALPPELPAKCWNLWQIRRDFPEARTLSGFAHWLNHQAATGTATSTPSASTRAWHATDNASRDGETPKRHPFPASATNPETLPHPSTPSPAPLFSSANPGLPPPPLPPASNILAGYSLGGRLALATLAAAPPGLWQAAILLAPHPGLSDPAERAARVIHDQTWAERCRNDPWPQLLADWNAQPVLAGGPAPSASECWRPEIASAFQDWSLGHQPDLRQTRTPILWITGADDLKFTTLAAKAATFFSPAENFDPPGPLRSTHHILPHCGHRLLQQSSQKIRLLIQDFLT